MYLKRITSKVGDDATEQSMKIINEVVPKYKDKFLELNKYELRLDTFFSQFLLKKCYESLSKVFVLIFCFMNRLQLFSNQPEQGFTYCFENCQGPFKC